MSLVKTFNDASIRGWQSPSRVYSQYVQLLGNDIAAGDLFGSSVAISNNGFYIVAGAPSTLGSGGDRYGQAYVFFKNTNVWAQQAKLVSTESSLDDEFGCSVAISDDGKYIAVGARGMAKVYIFSRDGTTWTQEAIIANPSGGTSLFGDAISFNSDATYLAVGDQANDTSAANAGRVFVYTRSGTTWTLQQAFTGTPVTAGDSVGWSVKLNADATYLFAGSPGDTPLGTQSGSGYIFTRSGTTWSQQQKISPTFVSGYSYVGAVFGRSCDMNKNGNVLIVGSPGLESNFGDLRVGAFYVYTRSGTTWTQQLVIRGPDLTVEPGFGTAVAMDQFGSILISGSPNDTATTGKATVYQGNNAIYNFLQTLIPTSTSTIEHFGESIAADADAQILVIGAPWADTPGNKAGAIFVFNS